MARNYLAIPYEYIDEFVEDITNEELGELVRGLLYYSRDGKEFSVEGRTSLLVKRLISQENRMQSHYNDAAGKHREAGKAGGRPKKDEGEKPNGFSGNQMVSEKNQMVFEETKKTYSESKSESKYKSEGEKESKEKKAAGAASTTAGSAKPKESQEEMYERLATVFEPGVVTDRLDHEIRLWLRYKTERKEAYKESGMAALLRKIVLDETLKHGEKKVCDLIEECMASGYRGIIWDRLDKPQSSGPGSRGRPDIVEQMRDW